MNKGLRSLAAVVALIMMSNAADAQTWTALTNQPPFPNPGVAVLLTDGTVLQHDGSTRNWWRLTPNAFGSYVNGTWAQVASMPAGYAPLYFASAVLPDGRLVVEGGEYNLGALPGTNLGAIYDPVANTWTSISPPDSQYLIGDAPSTVLANGTFMLGDCCGGPGIALLNASTLTWTFIGSGSGNEDGWTLMPNGKVLEIGIGNRFDSNPYAIYDPSTKVWTWKYGTPVYVFDENCDEIGPSVVRPDGTVFVIGGNSNTALYYPSTDTWAVGPTIPSSLGEGDGPAALLPNGKVLFEASPYCNRDNSGNPVWPSGVQFFEFDGSSLAAIAAPSTSYNLTASYTGHMLVLPTGEIYYTSIGSYLYSSSGTYQSAWQPTITTYPSTLVPGQKNYVISGTQFNGLSQGAMYGDDEQMATNYPLVRLKNRTSGHVFYARTHDHSSMGVATGTATVSTKFDVPANLESGATYLEVVANGIPSTPVLVNLSPADLTISKTHSGNFTQGQIGATYTLTVRNTGDISTNSTVRVVDSVPSGLEITGMSGTGWTCNVYAATCTTSNPLISNVGYPITVTVYVNPNAPASVVNTATVSGGGEQNTANDSSSNPTTISSLVLSSAANLAVWVDGTMSAYVKNTSTAAFTNAHITVTLNFPDEGLVFAAPAGCTLAQVGQIGSKAVYDCASASMSSGGMTIYPFSCSGSANNPGTITATLVTPTTPADTSSGDNSMTQQVLCNQSV